jgi:DNA-binding MarR family transcriptional regulator
MIPDKRDIVLLRVAIESPGAHKREIYRDLLRAKKGADSTLSRAIDCLAACGYLRLDKNPGTVQVWATEKAKRLIAKIDKQEAGQ